jgi:predicted GNAT superfamily acetyltransferase
MGLYGFTRGILFFHCEITKSSQFTSVRANWISICLQKLFSFFDRTIIHSLTFFWFFRRYETACSIEYLVVEDTLSGQRTVQRGPCVFVPKAYEKILERREV